MEVGDSSLIEQLEDLVLTEDRIVTCKWLSNRLNIHGNTAKQLLYALSRKLDNLSVTYLVSGCLRDGKEQRVTLVGDRDLDRTKGMMEVTSEHVFSVQRRIGKPEVSALYLAHTTADPKSTKREPPISLDMEVARKDVPPLATGGFIPNRAKTEKPPVAVHKDKTAATNNQKSSGKAAEATKKDEPTEEKKSETKSASVKSEKLKSPPGTLANGKTSPKKAEKKNTKKGAPVKDSQAIGAFFNRQASLASKRPPKVKEDTKVEEKENDSGKGVDKSPEASLSVSKAANGTPKTYGKKRAETKVSKKRKKSKDSDKGRKKLKRIVLASDSESSNGEGSDIGEESPLREDSPEPVAKVESDDEVIPPTPVEHGKKRVRVEVNRTYEEDGFILTKKEYVFKSEDEDTGEAKENTGNAEEEKRKEESAKKPAPLIPSAPVASRVSPVKNKQSSIMSFFKRK